MKSFLKKILYPEKIIFKKLNIKDQAFLIYIILGGVFISCLIACNLIFLKFFSLKINLLNITSSIERTKAKKAIASTDGSTRDLTCSRTASATDLTIDCGAKIVGASRTDLCCTRRSDKTSQYPKRQSKRLLSLLF